jgi:threonine dehydrogenase-like Zn-dependent dehydrogenase
MTKSIVVAQEVMVQRPGLITIVSRGLSLQTPEDLVIKTDYCLISNGTERTIIGGAFPPHSHWAKWVAYPFRIGYATVGFVVDGGSRVSGNLIGKSVLLRIPHASHAVVRANEIHDIPDGLSNEFAVWMPLARIALLAATRALPAPSVLVVGGGLLAQLTLRWLSVFRVETIVMLTHSDLAQELGISGGAHCVIQGKALVDDTYSSQRARDLQPAAVIDCTSDPNVLGWASHIVRTCGRIILVGDPPDPTARTLTQDVLLKGLTVIGVHDRLAFGRWDNKTSHAFFASAIANGSFPMHGLCTHIMPLEQASLAYSIITDSLTSHCGIMLRPE